MVPGDWNYLLFWFFQRWLLIILAGALAYSAIDALYLRTVGDSAPQGDRRTHSFSVWTLVILILVLVFGLWAANGLAQRHAWLRAKAVVATIGKCEEAVRIGTTLDELRVLSDDARHSAQVFDQSGDDDKIDMWDSYLNAATLYSESCDEWADALAYAQENETELDESAYTGTWEEASGELRRARMFLEGPDGDW